MPQMSCRPTSAISSNKAHPPSDIPPGLPAISPATRDYNTADRTRAPEASAAGRGTPTRPSMHPTPPGFPFTQQRAMRGVLAAGSLLLGLLLHAPIAAAPKPRPLEGPLVITQVPARGKPEGVARDPRDLVHDAAFDGARLVMVSTDRTTRVLSEGFHSACDPDISFDGKRMLFAGRRTAGDRWRIWEIGLDGQGLRAVSPEHLDARHPIHVSVLNTLESPKPWYTTVFVARDTMMNETGRPGVLRLYNVKLDGTELRQLTHNPGDSIDPVQLWDGRVIYASARFPQEPGAAPGRVGLFAVHIEGADMELFGAGAGARIQQMPCATPGGLVVFVEADQPTADGAGQLACVDQRRPHHLYRRLTHDAAHAFAHPAPLRGNQVLVARRPAKGRGTWGIFVYDVDRGACDALVDQSDFHELQAVTVEPRPQPDGHSTVVTLQGDYGTFYGMNCYTADAARQAGLRPGEVKRVRFIEGLPEAAADPALGVTGPGPVIPRRLVGEAPVEADGSFNVVVPADRPLLLQTLDERGMALGNCGWIWVRPKEVRGCIGCHQDPELTPENEYVQALRRPSDRLLIPAEERRSVTFTRDVVPILQMHCATAACHGGTTTPLKLQLGATPGRPEMLAAYRALTAPAEATAAGPAWPVSGRYVDAGRARTSWLVWQVLGTDTSRSWDSRLPAATPARTVTPMPHARATASLSPEELRVIIEWIDLGAQFEPLAMPTTTAASALPSP